MLTSKQRFKKRFFDIVLSFFGIFFLWWLIVLCWALATIDTRQNGLFTQARVGRDGRVFEVFKIRTMRDSQAIKTTVTRLSDPRITRLGAIFRRLKLDELPQLWNVLRGDMSFVGPRPDVPGFADRLSGEDRYILTLRPGITGPATLAYRNEEEILESQSDPDFYNREVIYPDKVRINLEYIRNWSLAGDIRYIWETVFGE